MDVIPKLSFSCQFSFRMSKSNIKKHSLNYFLNTRINYVATIYGNNKLELLWYLCYWILINLFFEYTTVNDLNCATLLPIWKARRSFNIQYVYMSGFQVLQKLPPSAHLLNFSFSKNLTTSEILARSCHICSFLRDYPAFENGPLQSGGHRPHCCLEW